MKNNVRDQLAILEHRTRIRRQDIRAKKLQDDATEYNDFFEIISRDIYRDITRRD